MTSQPLNTAPSQVILKPQIQLSSLNASLIVSVTGHRDPEDVDVLKGTFQQQIEALRKEKGLAAQNCTLLSAIAEGADTLAVEVALELGWNVIAPLPLPVAEYRRDFEGEAREVFDRLLTSCSHFFVGDAPGCVGDYETNYQEKKIRELQYAYVGEFLARHCEILIAFWDGIPGGLDRLGGTDDVVRMQLEGIPVHLLEMRTDGNLLDSPEVGSVIQIWTRRRRHQKHGETIGYRKHGEVQHLELKDRGQTPERRATRWEDWQQFVKEANQGDTPEDPYKSIPLNLERPNPYLASVREAYLRADGIAGKLQREVSVWFRRISGVAIAFTFCVATANAFGDQAWGIWPLLASWGFLLTSWMFTQIEKKSKRANRHQDYRALAEAWRICFFWRAIGIHDPIDASYLSQHRGELDWIRHALRSSDLHWRAATSSQDSSTENGYPTATPHAFDTAFRWVEGQSSYFKVRKVPKDRKRLTTLRNWSWALLLFGVGANAVITLAELKSSPFASTHFGTNLWHFVTTFVSADLLSSPFVPAALLLAHMGSWPLATEENTKNQNARTREGRQRKRRLRLWFERQSRLWHLVALISALLLGSIVSAIYLGILPDEKVVPFLKLITTICFFLPALIFVEADFHALPEHVTRYERMFAVFERARQMLEDIPPSRSSKEEPFDWSEPQVRERARRIYRELGREALRENGEWLAIHRERPLDMEV